MFFKTYFIVGIMGIIFQKTKLWKNSCRGIASYVFKNKFIQHSWREQNRENMLNINSCWNTWWNRVQNPSFRFMLVTRCVNSQSQRGGWNICSKSTGGKFCVATWSNDGNEGWNEGLVQYGSNEVNLDDSILPSASGEQTGIWQAIQAAWPPEEQ